ncbi:hypothetical protein B7463_g4374, partial [Scytalidium lignicola]
MAFSKTLYAVTALASIHYVGARSLEARAGWSSLGCYTDSVNARSLSYAAGVPGGPTAMTVELCESTCLAAGYSYAGVEYADECYCGNALQNGGAPAPDGNAGCNMACDGNSGETCGGANRLNLYQYSSSTPSGGNPLPGWTFQGCYTDNVNGRTLGTAEGVTGGMTNEKCQTACANAGFSIAGTEYAGECWCGNTYANSGGPAPDGSAGCSMACSGDSGETCGGSNRLDVYTHGGGGSSPTTTTTSSGSQPTSTYALVNNWNSGNFFNEWSFFTDADPTHGYVQYVGEAAAQAAGLINTNNNQIYMGVDHTTTNPASGRQSVRLVTNAAFTHGLFIADIQHMPNACGAWPAWWMTGPNWPNNGEIDIIEGVNAGTTDSITLHTSAGCTINTSGSASGTSLSSPDCNNNNAYNGCGVSTSNTLNYGPGFNNNGGGVYAMRWTSSAIAIWFFPRNSIPGDITSNTPNPSGWAPQPSLSTVVPDAPSIPTSPRCRSFSIRPSVATGPANRLSGVQAAVHRGHPTARPLLLRTRAPSVKPTGPSITSRCSSK